MKKVKKDINRWKDTVWSWIGRINIHKMTMLLKEIYRFKATPIKLPMAVFTELEPKKVSKVIWKHMRPQIAKEILKKEKWNCRNQAPWFQTTLQSYSHQNSMVLAQRQTHRSLEQDRKPRNKPMHLWSINLQQRRQEHTMKRQSLQ